MIEIKSLSKDQTAAVIKNARLYLGDRSIEGDSDITEDIALSMNEIAEMADFRATFREFSLSFIQNGIFIEELELNIASEDLLRLFKDCKRICVVASTLGIGFDRFLTRVSNKDMSHAVVVDATGSALLECLTDLYEDRHLDHKRTFRFAPGYGDVDISLNGPLMRGICADKLIGLSLTPSGLFLPQKSMLGLIGV